MIDVPQEQVQDLDPLFDAAFQHGPFRRRQRRRDHVERQDPVDRLPVGIDRERDAQIEQFAFGILRPRGQFLHIHPGQAVDDGCVACAVPGLRAGQFAEIAARVVGKLVRLGHGPLIA